MWICLEETPDHAFRSAITFTKLLLQHQPQEL